MATIMLCREFPPAPGGGIGTYTIHMARALAATGEVVHVIGQRWPGAEAPRQEALDGRLVVHRLPVESPGMLFGTRSHPALAEGVALELHRAGGPAANFAWQAAELVDHLVTHDAITSIEAPEYEAPMHFVLRHRDARRRSGTFPPCVVHLHSPTELVAIANGVDATTASQLPLARLERAAIHAADRLICPSHYLARQVAERMAIAPARIGVVPYPKGPATPLHRDIEVWTEGVVLFVGRLELRKGILEWIDAAVSLAASRPGLRFAFVGADHIDSQVGGTDRIRRRIPKTLRERFVFHDHQGRENIAGLLAGARLAVVPSRWENFPYTCIEAMASGLPVVVAPTGGMAEMIEHGENGWIATSQGPADLATAVRTALDGGPERLAQAGARAAAAIAAQCGDARVLAERASLARRDPSDLPPVATRGALGHDPVEEWRAPRPPISERIGGLVGAVHRGLARPRRTWHHAARHLRWRLAGGDE